MITAIEAGVLISIILILLGVMLHSNKKIAIVQMTWVWMLVSFNNGGIDYEGNQFIYENASIINQTDFGLSEWINYPLSELIYSYGFTFVEYTFITTSFFLIIFFIVVNRLVNNVSLFMSAFMIYPMMFIIIHKRFTLAMMVFVIALLLFMKGKKRLSLVCMLTSTGFHLSTLVMIPYIIKDKILRLSKRIIFVVVLIEFLIFYGANKFLVSLVADESMKANDYMSADISFLAGAFFCGVELLMTLLTCFIVTKTKSDNCEIATRKKFIQEVNIVSLFYLPLLALNSAFFRYYRIIALTSLFVIVDEVKGGFNNNSARYYCFWLYLLLMVVSISLLLSYGKLDWHIHLQTMFEYNEVMQMLF